MTVAAIQTDPAFGAIRENIASALRQMNDVQADLFVLPELFASGYNFTSAAEAVGLAEPFPGGPVSKALSAFAHDRKCIVVYGFAESAGGRVFNSAAILGPDGLESVYRKIHLFDREKLFFAPGDGPFPVHETRFGRIGIMICFDWYFPESMRTLALRGARIVAHPSNLVLPNCPESMKTRCLENRVFAVTANRVGSEDRGGVQLTYIGQSQITSTKGDVLKRCSEDRAEVAVVSIDETQADRKEVAGHNHLFNDRRPEFYA